MGEDTPAGGFIRAGRGTVNCFKGEDFIDFALKTGDQRKEVKGTLGVVIGGIRLGVGANFGDELLSIEVLGEISEEEIKIFIVFEVSIGVKRIFMPRNEMER